MVITRTQASAGEKARDLGARAERLKGRIAIVTGADSGIGQAVALALAKEGADVAVSFHSDEDGATETLREVERAGRRGVVAHLDQTKPEEVRRFFAHVRDELGVPDVLVNNAGTMGESKPAKDLTDDEWDLVVRTNLHGPFYCAREFVRGLEQKLRDEPRASDLEGDFDPRDWTNGVIVNVTSVHEDAAMAGASAYNAAKGGLRNLTRTLALELAEMRIRVVNVAPGMVVTPMNEEAMEDPEKRAEQVRGIPMRRGALPTEIATVVAFLASDDASYVHGSTVFVDGGFMQNVSPGA